MPDYGSRMADKAMRTVQRRLRTTYAQAEKDLKKKLDEFLKRYAKKDAIKRIQLSTGEISKQEYADWKAGQVFMRKQWEREIANVNQILFRSNEEAALIVHEKKMDVFVDNYNHFAFDTERRTGISFDIYDTHTLARLMEHDPQLLPKWRIDQPKDYRWNQKKINNILKRSMIEGESIPETAKRLCKDLCTMNENKMLLFARTAMTGAQNAGRMQMLHDAQSKGIRTRKQWLATLDRRTRDSHRHLDGQERDVDEPFDSDYGHIMFPGDPEAHPGDVYNCRCTLTYIYPDYPSEISERIAYDEWIDEDGELHRESFVMGKNTTYGDWLAEKKKRQQARGIIPGKKPQAKKPAKSTAAPANLLTDAERAAVIAYDPGASAIFGLLDRMSVDRLAVGTFKKQPTEQEIIDRLGGGDMTSGSCSSLAFSYAANRTGHDVLDFRGGDSRKQFASNYLIDLVTKSKDVESYREKAYDDYTASHRLLKRVQPGKEYYFATGRHAAIIRADGNGGYQYLELQSRSGNGWYKLTDLELRYRFGCQHSHTSYGRKYELPNFLAEVQSLGKCKAYRGIMEYINTEENKQQKGKSGHVK